MAMHWDIRRFDEVTSTNDLVKAAISAGDPEGTVVVARTQTGGYGRRGHGWSSKPGGLYMSVLLRPRRSADEIATLSLVTAIAVRRAVAAFLPDDAADAVRIKWPNDVVVMANGQGDGPFQKICGISLEQRGDGLCIGVGVNVRRAPSEGAHQGSVAAGPNRGAAVAPGEEAALRPKNVPVYMEDIVSKTAPSVDAMRDAVLAELADVYERWQAGGFGVLRQEFMDHFALEGFKIRIDETGDDGPVRCEVRGINELGHLIVLPEGERILREIAAGTVTIIR